MTMSMEQIHRIKELQLQQKGAYQIAKELGLDPKTVRKYMKQEDFSPKPPVPVAKPSKLDPYKPTIDAWLLQDVQNWYKQRHTGKRVYDRLVQKYPEFNCSYPTVNQYVTSFRQRQHLNKNGYLELQWHPGEAQADFGECDVIVNGVRQVSKYLVLSFPHSNAGFVQCFLGETTECLCQGLMEVLVQKYLYTPNLDGILNQIRSMFTIYGVPKIFCTRTVLQIPSDCHENYVRFEVLPFE